MRSTVRLAFFLVAMLAIAPACAAEGKFVGELVAKLAADGRNMVLTQPFGYIDPKGREWDVPEGVAAVEPGESVAPAFDPTFHVAAVLQRGSSGPGSVRYGSS